jgi:DNA/RNA endonuclease YhcR with UshA esterase domain
MKKRSYFVWFKSDDGVIVNVKDDVNRPNNDDCDTILQTWISDNYGNVEYEYTELDSVETIEI